MPDVYHHRRRPRLQWSPQPLRPYPPRCAPPSPARPRYRKRCRGARPQPLSPVSRLPPTLCVRRTAYCCSCAHDASRGRGRTLSGPGSDTPPLRCARRPQLPQQLGRGAQHSPRPIVWARRDISSSLSASPTILWTARAVLSSQSMQSPFTADIPLPFAAAHSTRSKFRQRTHQLHYPIRKKVVGVLHRPASQDVGRVQSHLHPTTLQVSRLPGKPQAALEHLPRLLMQYQARPKQLKRTLGERPVFHFDTQRHLPAYVEVRPLLGLGVTRPVMCLKIANRLGGTLSLPLSAQYSSAKSSSRNSCPRIEASRP